MYTINRSIYNAIIYAEHFKGETSFSYPLDDELFSNSSFSALEERYDFACEHLRNRIENFGIVLPEKYSNLSGKFLSWEHNHWIGVEDRFRGRHFAELTEIFKARREIIKFKKLILGSGKIVKTSALGISKIKKESKRLLQILIKLYEEGISWRCKKISKEYLVIEEPLSKKLAKIVVDMSGYRRSSISTEDLSSYLSLLAQKWNMPLNSDKFREGTLTDCGWHAYIDTDKRRKALDLAVLVWGKSHIIGALKISRKLKTLANYLDKIDDDIGYVEGKEKQFVRMKREFDAVIYVTLI